MEKIIKRDGKDYYLYETYAPNFLEPNNLKWVYTVSYVSSSGILEMITDESLEEAERKMIEKLNEKKD